jgi:hypothetical protein
MHPPAQSSLTGQDTTHFPCTPVCSVSRSHGEGWGQQARMDRRGAARTTDACSVRGCGSLRARARECITRAAPPSAGTGNDHASAVACWRVRLHASCQAPLVWFPCFPATSAGTIRSTAKNVPCQRVSNSACGVALSGDGERRRAVALLRFDPSMTPCTVRSAGLPPEDSTFFSASRPFL